MANNFVISWVQGTWKQKTSTQTWKYHLKKQQLSVPWNPKVSLKIVRNMICNYNYCSDRVDYKERVNNLARLRECFQWRPLSILWEAIIGNILATFSQCYHTHYYPNDIGNRMKKPNHWANDKGSKQRLTGIWANSS